MQAPNNSALPSLPRPAPPVAGSGSPLRRARPRGLQLALFLAALSWFVCARTLAENAANGFAQRFELEDYRPLTAAVLFLFLLVCGFALLRTIEARRAPLGTTLGLPRRATWRAEWALGAAFGWGLAVASVLPMALGRTLNIELWTTPRAFFLLGIDLATLLVATLANALAIYGYGFQRLTEATGPVRATLVLMALVAIRTGLTPTPYGTADGARILVALLATMLLCMCWFRTHGLWLLWGLHFAWAASTGVLFGLPIFGDFSFGSVVDTRAVGRVWLTGGDYGPAGAALSILILLAAIPVLIRVTGDYAWKYTHPPIIPAGIEVTVAPPAAHDAMEQAIEPAPLVQIQPVEPPTPMGGRTSE